MRTGWPRAPRPWRSGGLLPPLLAAAAVLVAVRLLAAVFTVFQHAYLNSYWLVPGSQVTTAYWAAVRFAFHVTVLVSVAIGLLVALIVVEIARAADR